jgi:hypothetical protein
VSDIRVISIRLASHNGIEFLSLSVYPERSTSAPLDEDYDRSESEVFGRATSLMELTKCDEKNPVGIPTKREIFSKRNKILDSMSWMGNGVNSGNTSGAFRSVRVAARIRTKKKAVCERKFSARASKVVSNRVTPLYRPNDSCRFRR